MSASPCLHCGRPAEDHHEFEPMPMPPGCQCDPGSWSPLTPRVICASYRGDGLEYCWACEHDSECHGGPHD